MITKVSHINPSHRYQDGVRFKVEEEDMNNFSSYINGQLASYKVIFTIVNMCVHMKTC